MTPLRHSRVAIQCDYVCMLAIFLVKLFFLVHSTDARSSRAIISNICEKIIKIIINKTQYDWFPRKSQNSKKFSAKFKQNPTTSKNNRAFLNILGGTPRRSQQILGVKLTSKLNSQHHRNTQCANFRQNQTTLKKYYLRQFPNIWGG